MKLTNILEEVLGQKSKIKILRCLFKRKMEMTGRQVAQFCGLNHRTCQLALRDLEQQGIVVMRRVGKSNLFKLKQDNYLIGQLLGPLFEQEEHLFHVRMKKGRRVYKKSQVNDEL